MNGCNSSLIKNSVYKGLLNIFNLVVPLITIPYIYRVLSPSSVGNFEYCNTLFSYFSLWGVLGIYTYGMREVSSVRNNEILVNRIYSTLFCIGIFSNLFVSLIFVAFAFIAFSETLLLKILLLFSLNFVANIFYTEWVNEAFEDFKFIAIKTCIVRLLYVAGVFVFVKVPADIERYVILVVIFNFCNYILSFVYSRKYTQLNIFALNVTKKDLKRYLPALFYILLLNNSSVFYTTLDRVMLGSYEGTQSVAYYSVGQKIMEIVRSVLITFTYVSLPRLSYYCCNNVEKYEYGIQKLFQFILFLSIPLTIGLCILSKDIVFLFAGKQYEQAVFPLMVFSVRIFTLMIENVTAQQILFLHKKEKIVSGINIIWGIGNLLINYVLIKKGVFSPTTAIFSTLCVEVGLLCSEYIYIRKKMHLKITISKRMVFRYLFFSLIFLPIACVVKNLFTNHIMSFILIILSCMTSYMACLYYVKDELFKELCLRIKAFQW